MLGLGLFSKSLNFSICEIIEKLKRNLPFDLVDDRICGCFAGTWTNSQDLSMWNTKTGELMFSVRLVKLTPSSYNYV